MLKTIEAGHRDGWPSRMCTERRWNSVKSHYCILLCCSARHSSQLNTAVDLILFLNPFRLLSMITSMEATPQLQQPALRNVRLGESSETTTDRTDAVQCETCFRCR